MARTLSANGSGPVKMPATRVGFIEPEFRVLLARLAARDARRRDELETLRIWAEGIVHYYTVGELSPGIGATMALALQTAGYRKRCNSTFLVVDLLIGHDFH